MKRDFAPWLLVPCAALSLSAVSFLAPRQPAQAAPPAVQAAAPKAPAYDDGDGDELLEHWSDPKYAREERSQLAGIAGVLLLLGTTALARRKNRRPAPALPAEADFLKQPAARPAKTRKAA